MKNFKRLAILILVVFLTMSIAVFVACNRNATVKLDVGEGGTLSQNSVKAKAGSKLTDVVKDITPETEDGVTFVGWFLNDEPITDNDILPKEGVTLIAKYDARYTINVYYTDPEGNFNDEYEVTTGTARLGEPLELSAKDFLGTLDDKNKPNRLSTDSLGKNEVFSAYMTVTYVRIRYNVNRAGENAAIPDDYIMVGRTGKLADGNEFGLGGELRFVGWSKTATGDVVYRSGEVFDTSSGAGTVNLFANWDDNALTDFFGGSDYLFAVEEENAVYLHRYGLDERKGSFNPETGIFAFEEGGDVKLEGKVSGENYYYFEDLTGQTAISGTGNGDTITFNGSNSVTYKQGISGAVSIDGTYDIDPITGEYIFTADGMTFVFAINTQTTSSGVTLVFNRANSEENGFYVEETGKTAIYLDGMIDDNGVGGALLYNITDGKLVAAMRIFYNIWEDEVILNDNVVENYYLFEETYAARMSSGTTIFLFRISDSQQPDVDGVHIRGTYKVSDGFEGHYYDDPMHDEPDLLVDGFGAVLQKKNGDYVEGTYTIGSNELRVLENDAFITFRDEWIETTIDGTTVCERLFLNIVPLHAEVSRPALKEWAHLANKVYTTAQNHIKAYFYDSSEIGAYVLLEMHDDVNGTYYVSTDRGQIDAEEDGLYRFTSLIPGLQVAPTYLFKYDSDGKIVTTIDLAQCFESEDGELKLDEWGTLTYKGESYEFGSWARDFMFDAEDEFALEFFYQISGSEYLDIVSMRIDYTTQTDSEGTTTVVTTRTPFDESNLVDMVWKMFYGQDSMFDVMYLLDGNNAIIGLPTQEYYLFIIDGTISEGKVAGEYHFTANRSLDIYNQYINDADLTEAYMDFYFKYEEKGGERYAIRYVFANEYEAQSGAKFRVDGYGNAVFVDTEGAESQGTYEAMDALGKYMYEFISGNERHVISIIYDENGDAVDFLVDPEGANIYYYLTGEGTIYRNYYAVLLGDATETTPGTIVYGDVLGTYIRTGNDNIFYGKVDGWVEYKLVLQLTDSKGQPYKETVNIITNVLNFESDDHSQNWDYNVFIEQMTPQAGLNFEIENYPDAEIYGDGYTATYLTFDGETYYLGSVGIGVISDNSPLASDYHWEDDFENGTQVIFKTEYVVDTVLGTRWLSSQSFLFDVLPNGELSLRDNYNATYALYNNGNITSQRLYLDGHGHATVYDADGNMTDEGDYLWMNSQGCLMFTSTRNGSNFRFNIAQMSFSDELWYVYFVMNDEQAYVGDDWSVLLLGEIRESDDGGIYNGYYIDRMGYQYEGFYSFLADDVVRFEFTNGGTSFYDVSDGKFFVNNELFIIRDHALLGYQGDVITDLVIPDEVTRIAAGAFSTVSRLGGTGYIFDLNNVEIIDDYAFFGVHEISALTIESDKVTYVGDYAFYMPYPLSASSSEDIPRSWLRNVSFPNATYIGDYAFNGNNMMCLGETKLNKVTHIGAYAFSHNARLSHEKMILDLTEADVTAIEMDRNAFLPGPNTDIWMEDGWPVIIWVKDEAALEWANAHWYEEIADCVMVKIATMEGVGYFDFVSRDYLRFGEMEGSIGTIEYYKYGKDGYELTENYCSYTFVNGAVRVTLPDESTVEFARNAKSITIGDATYYSQDALMIFNVVDENDETVEFRFNFAVEVSNDYGDVSIDIQILNAIYGNYNTYNVMMDNVDYACSFSYETAEEVLNTKVDFENWTSKSEKYGITVEDETGNYRATLERPLGDGYYELTLEVKTEDGSYETLFDGVRRTAQNVWEYKQVVDGAEITYNVTYDPDTNLISVNVAILRTLIVTSADNNYRATFTYAEGEENVMIALNKLEQRNGQSFVTVYYALSWEYGVSAVNPDENHFIVTVSANGRKIWDVVFNPAHEDVAAQITVTYSEDTLIRVDSEHTENPEQGIYENYFVVALLIDEHGDVVGIEEVRSMTYTGNGYDGFSFSLQGLQNQGDGTFVGVYENRTYTIHVEKTTDESGAFSYKVTVSVGPAA